ncbi:putative transcription factor WD40-like family [Helianthus annuus]|nr:putative transcription factor WD40-like family [Helianthus annuus]
MEYEEHEKRAWSVDFSRTEPTMLVSGNDDCKVKIWCTKQETSVVNIDMKANICSDKYNPRSSYHVAVSFYTFKSLSVCIHSFAYWHLAGGFCIRYYDLRNISQPLK